MANRWHVLAVKAARKCFYLWNNLLFSLRRVNGKAWKVRSLAVALSIDRNWLISISFYLSFNDRWIHFTGGYRSSPAIDVYVGWRIETVGKRRKVIGGTVTSERGQRFVFARQSVWFCRLRRGEFAVLFFCFVFFRWNVTLYFIIEK